MIVLRTILLTIAFVVMVKEMLRVSYIINQFDIPTSVVGTRECLGVKSENHFSNERNRHSVTSNTHRRSYYNSFTSSTLKHKLFTNDDDIQSQNLIFNPNSVSVAQYSVNRNGVYVHFVSRYVQSRGCGLDG